MTDGNGVGYVFAAIAVMTLATFLTRVAPFVLLRRFAHHPLLNYIGTYFPASVMLVLVVYCVKDASWLSFPFGFPETVGILVVSGTHLLRRNSLLSIGLGTVVYMLLLNRLVS